MGRDFRSPKFCGVQIKLSTKSFGREAATVAAQGIANIANTLQEADLSDIIAGVYPGNAQLCDRVHARVWSYRV